MSLFLMKLHRARAGTHRRLGQQQRREHQHHQQQSRICGCSRRRPSAGTRTRSVPIRGYWILLLVLLLLNMLVLARPFIRQPPSRRRQHRTATTFILQKGKQQQWHFFHKQQQGQELSKAFKHTKCYLALRTGRIDIFTSFHESSTRRCASTGSLSSHDTINDFAPTSFSYKDKGLVISYLTDVEGDKEYLHRYVERSKVLQFKNVTAYRNQAEDDNDDHEEGIDNFRYRQYIDFTKDNAMLVFGGDMWDKGGHDLYVIRQLLDLKRRFPDRVLFVLGNRDINKLRMLQELGLYGHDLPKHPGLTWFKGTGRVGDPDSNLPPEDGADRLKWMLGQTMGSPDAFEHRKNELIEEAQVEANALQETSDDDRVIDARVTDDDVVKSYQLSCHPNGELGQFISQANLAIKLGPLLFVHGSLPLTKDALADSTKTTAANATSIWDDFTFCMPWLRPEESAKDYNVYTVDDWIYALNKFCKDKVSEWKQEIARIESKEEENNSIWAYRGGYHYGPSYSSLIQYGMGMTADRKANPTVVYTSFTPSGMPDRFLPDVDDGDVDDHDDDDGNENDPGSKNIVSDYFLSTKQFFERGNIQLILTGHKPQGDMPTPIRVDSSSWIVACDTSYSSETIWYNNDEQQLLQQSRQNLGRGNAISFRGDVAVTEVLVQLDDTLSIQRIQYHGVLSDGTEYQIENLLDHQISNSTLGLEAPTNLLPPQMKSPHETGRWWTKYVSSDDDTYLFHAGEGFKVWNLPVVVSSKEEGGKQE